jgi:hypothetical protein
MLKKLLDEFAEKEAHTREEINVVNQQIGELEKRIATAIARQTKIASDRDKIWEMKNRYAGGRFYARSVYGGSPPTPQPIPTAVPSVVMTAAPAATSMLSDAASQLFSSPPPTNPQHSGPVPTSPPASNSLFTPPPPIQTASSQAALPPQAPAAAPSALAQPMSAQPSAQSQAQAPMPQPMPMQAPIMPTAVTSLPPTPIETAINQVNSGTFQALPLAPTPSSQPSADKFDILDLFAPLSTGAPPAAVSESSQPNENPASADFYSSNPPQAPSSQPAQASHADDESASDLDDENDDTVKSINDALRGLFR